MDDNITFSTTRKYQLVAFAGGARSVGDFQAGRRRSHKHWRCGVMGFPVAPQPPSTGIGIAIAASVGTGIVHADVNALHTAAGLGLSGILAYTEGIPAQFFHLGFIYAGARVNADAVEILRVCGMPYSSPILTKPSANFRTTELSGSCICGRWR